MLGRYGISTIVYSKDFITKAWATRAEMLDYERRGLFQFLYITACGHAESILCDYLKAVIFMPILDIKKMAQSPPQREAIINGSKVFADTEHELRAVQGILENTVEEINKAPFERIKQFHRTIVGSTIKDIIGSALADDLDGLVSIRNLLAHGRQLYVDIDDFFQVDTSFDQHPLRNAIKSLKQVGLFKPVDTSSANANEINTVIFRDEVVTHFWNASVSVGDQYQKLADEQMMPKLTWTEALAKLQV